MMKISEIKEKLSIDQVLSHYNLSANQNKMLCCPFHADKTPSMKMYPETNTVFCFSGSCEKNGKSIDVIDFIMYQENSTKSEAIEKAGQLLGEVKPKKQTKPAVSEKPTNKGRIALLSKVFEEAEGSLKRSIKAKAYCEARNISNIGVGFFSDRFYQNWTETEKEAALEIGLLKKQPNGQLSSSMRNCILFAQRNKENEIVSIYGRNIQNTEKGTKHLYLKGAHQGLYPQYPSKTTQQLILTESIIDAATVLKLQEIKDYSVLACYGTNGFTEEHKAAISELNNLEEIIFAFDGDEAGRKAVAKYQAEFEAQFPALKLSKLELPEDEDINSLLESHEPEIISHLLATRKELQASHQAAEEQETTAVESNKKGTSAPYCLDSPNLDVSNSDCLNYTHMGFIIQVWGGVETNNMHRLKVNLHIYQAERKYPSYREDVNLYSHRQVKSFAHEASEELEVHSTEIKQLLNHLTKELESYRVKQKQDAYKAIMPTKPTLTPEEESKALELLKHPKLAYKIKEILEITGLVGQGDKGLLFFLIYLTRFFKQPLHAIIFGSSGSGKTHLQTGVSNTLPDEEVRNATSLSENTLYYSPKGFWSHVVLLIEDLNGAGSAEYVLREFMSKQSITKYTTEKDERGTNEQKILKVEGPVCVSGCTTKENIYEDNANRSFLLHVDDSAKQQAEVLEYIKNRQAGLIDQDKENKATDLLKNAQRMLKPIKVVNKYAPQLMIPERVFKKYRTLNHYLSLINTIALLYQYQREIKEDNNGEPYIEVTLSDIELANSLSKETLIRKSDELTGENRKFFEALKEYVKKNNLEEGFHSKDIRTVFRLHPQKLSRYLLRLEQLDCIRQISYQKRNFEYKITDWNEYEKLQEGVNILDGIYARLNAVSSQN